MYVYMHVNVHCMHVDACTCISNYLLLPVQRTMVLLFMVNGMTCLEETKVS